MSTLNAALRSWTTSSALRRLTPSPRWMAAVEVARLSPGLALALALLTALAALVPVALSLSMGAVVAALSGVPPLGAGPGVWLPLAALGLLFVAQQVLGARLWGGATRGTCTGA